MLIALTALVVALQRDRPWLVVGWAWFLVSLLPVIGIVQVGNAAMADRYAYLPFIGLYIAASWSLSGLVRELALGPSARRAAVMIAVLGFAALALLARGQVAVWHDDFALFRHALMVTERNALAHTNLAAALGRAGELVEAEAHLRAAIEIDQSNSATFYNLGHVLTLRGMLEEAVPQYQRALDISPDDFDTNYQLAATYGRLGRYRDAEAHYSRAIEIQPGHYQAKQMREKARRLMQGRE
jgi:tetratricopeptide (TPR) repeat protein